jgi:Protein phosphatase 2C
MLFRCYPTIHTPAALSAGSLPADLADHHRTRRWTTVVASARGARHVIAGLPNQDATRAAVASDPAGGAVIAVADGHGSREYVRSQRGARAACDALVTCGLGFLEEFSRSPNRTVQVLDGQVLSQIVYDAWQCAVREDYAKHPFTADEWAKVPEQLRTHLEQWPATAYGCTLLAVITWSAGLLAMQLGDGDIVSVDKGHVRRLIPAVELDGSLTHSLCDARAVDRFRFLVEHFNDAPPECLMLRTDGWSNAFNTESDCECADRELAAWLMTTSQDSAVAELESHLSTLSAAGCSDGDDVSVAALLLREEWTDEQ